MRIVIDLQSCQSGSSLGGIGRYSLELAKAMVTNASTDEFIVVLNNRNDASIHKIRAEFKNILPQNDIRIFDIPTGCSFFHKDPATIAAAQAIRETFIANLNPDAVHLTSHFEGLGDEVVTSIPHSGPPVAVTLYDLIPFVQQKTYLTDKVAKEHYFNKFWQLQHAGALLAISQYSADEARQHLPHPPALIVNIRGGVDEKFKILPADAPGVAAALERHGTGKKFLLYTASFDQRKNHERLVKAFASVPSEVRNNYKLVMAGNGWPGIYAQLKRVGSSLGLPHDNIVFTGRVTDDDLVALYNRCALFVFPPLWEGLGLPPLEAMACGAPAIGSSTTSVPEVIGWSEAMFDPNDVKDIARHIERALTDQDYRRDLLTHAASHHPKFTWQASAQTALSAIKQMHVNGGAVRPSIITKQPVDDKGWQSVIEATRGFQPASTERLHEFAYCLASNELESGHTLPGMTPPKIGWISSWGTRCGIASYSKNLVDHLTGDVRIFASHAPDAPEHEENVDRCWVAGGTDDLAQLRRCLSEHDLTDIVIQFNYGFFNFFNLARLVQEQVQIGRRIYFTLHSTVDPRPDIIRFRLADLSPAFAASSAIFVHSENDVSRLAAIGFSSNVVVVPQGVRLIDAPLLPRNDTRQTRIASYGFFLPGKGLLELIEAIAHLRGCGREIELKMVNADYGDASGVSVRHIADAKQRIGDLGLNDHVTMETGYLTDEASIAHLRTADLIVYPYQQTGESSSAAVRMGLASGRPVAVTPIAIFDDVRSATHTMPGTTPTEIAAGIDIALGLQSTHAPQAAKINACATAWCASNDVRHVASYFQRIIVQKGASQSWEVFANPDLASLPRGNATLRDGVITSSAAPAVLVHGPYLTLPAGLYRVVVDGTATSKSAKPAGLLKLTAACGNIVLSSIDIPTCEGRLADVVFSCSQTMTDFEISLLANENAAVSLNGYRLLRRRFR